MTEFWLSLSLHRNVIANFEAEFKVNLDCAKRSETQRKVYFPTERTHVQFISLRSCHYIVKPRKRLPRYLGTLICGLVLTERIKSAMRQALMSCIDTQIVVIASICKQIGLQQHRLYVVHAWVMCATSAMQARLAR
jgi:hypothetical protein